MTTTILAVIALAGQLAPTAKPEFQTQTDYGQAMKVAATEKKPLAVLIGKGNQFTKLMADPKLTAEAKKLLTEKYVCLTIDVGTENGKSLASQFQMADGGLVISSTGGSHQAFRQSGTVTATDLSQHAATYASTGTVPSTTVTAGNATTYTPSGSIIPSSYSTPTFSPSGTYNLGQPAFGAPRCTSFG